VIVFTGDTGLSDAVTELAKGAYLLVSETSLCQDRMQEMINDDRWQAMTLAEQAGIMRQATQGHMTIAVIGKMAAMVICPWAEEGEETLSRPNAHCQRPDGILTGSHSTIRS
jgi:hypothetical protein